MEAPEEKQKKHEAKKHIEFKDVEKRDGKKKEQGYSRGKSSKLGPKYDRELKKFREETLQKIKIFRNARMDWTRLTGGEVDGQKIDSKIYYGLEIDKRRAAIMKKLGFKINMVRPHRKTLRPHRYFTMKKRITVLDSDYGGFPYGPGRLAESPVIREFRKKAKKSALRLAGKKESEGQKLLSAENLKTGERIPGSVKHGKVTKAEPLERELSGSTIEKEGETPDAEALKTEEDVSKEKELSKEEVKEVGELLSKESKMEFDKILKELKATFGFDENSVTDEDKEEMKKIWKEYRSGSKKRIKKRPQSREKLEEPHSFKFFQKFNPKKGKWWRKQRKRMESKTELPKGAKPCTCQILQGDGVVIVKNVCECALQCRRTMITGSQSEETPSLTNAKVVTASPKPALSSNIASKIVDSLEIIRKRVTSKASRIQKTDMKDGEEKENAIVTGAEPQKLKENEIKDIHVPNQKFDSSTSVAEKPADNESNEKNKMPEQTQESDGEVLDEEVGDLNDLKFKTKKHPKAPQKDDIVLPEKINKKKGSLTEGNDSFKELKEVKEVVKRKEVKPRKTWSTVSGKQKIDPESKTPKTLDDSGTLKSESQLPKPILGKVKHRKTKINHGHVSFDVEAGQSPSSSFLKYGEKKIKTVLSVVNIIKKK